MKLLGTNDNNTLFIGYDSQGMLTWVKRKEALVFSSPFELWEFMGENFFQLPAITIHYCLDNAESVIEAFNKYGITVNTEYYNNNTLYKAYFKGMFIDISSSPRETLKGILSFISTHKAKFQHLETVNANIEKLSFLG